MRDGAFNAYVTPRSDYLKTVVPLPQAGEDLMSVEAQTLAFMCAARTGRLEASCGPGPPLIPDNMSILCNYIWTILIEYNLFSF